MSKIVQALTIACEFVGQHIDEYAIAEMAMDLTAYPEEQVLAALKRCRQELRSIKFIDIVDRIPGGHPGVEEAWGLIARVMNNEQISICWTDEMRQAYGAAAPLAADRVAARLAFKETYTKLVCDARALRKPIAWGVSLGWDPGMRDECTREAARRNLITQSTAAKLLAHDPPTKEAAQVLDACGKRRIGR